MLTTMRTTYLVVWLQSLLMHMLPAALFTGCDDGQCVKLWDLRARAVVYDLSTGNNCVQAMAWDSKRSTLYAATDRDFHDYLSSRPLYRHARIPQWAKRNPAAIDDVQRHWPRPACHREDYYGYAYDAPGHALCTSFSYMQSSMSRRC